MSGKVLFACLDTAFSFMGNNAAKKAWRTGKKINRGAKKISKASHEEACLQREAAVIESGEDVHTFKFTAKDRSVLVEIQKVLKPRGFKSRLSFTGDCYTLSVPNVTDAEAEMLTKAFSHMNGNNDKNEGNVDKKEKGNGKLFRRIVFVLCFVWILYLVFGEDDKNIQSQQEQTITQEQEKPSEIKESYMCEKTHMKHVIGVVEHNITKNTLSIMYAGQKNLVNVEGLTEETLKNGDIIRENNNVRMRVKPSGDVSFSFVEDGKKIIFSKCSTNK